MPGAIDSSDNAMIIFFRRNGAIEIAAATLTSGSRGSRYRESCGRNVKMAMYAAQIANRNAARRLRVAAMSVISIAIANSGEYGGCQLTRARSKVMSQNSRATFA